MMNFSLRRETMMPTASSASTSNTSPGALRPLVKALSTFVGEPLSPSLVSSTSIWSAPQTRRYGRRPRPRPACCRPRLCRERSYTWALQLRREQSADRASEPRVSVLLPRSPWSHEGPCLPSPPRGRIHTRPEAHRDARRSEGLPGRCHRRWPDGL